MDISVDPRQKDKVTAGQEQVVRKELKKLFSLRLRKGHILWEFTPETGRLQRAEFKDKSADLRSGRIIRVVHHKPECVYFQALNLKNAIKKIRKSGYNNQITT